VWEQPDRARLRTSFGSVAELYDRARPEYPRVVFDDIAELAGLEPGAAVLEIGPGTGKATVELVRRGYEVTGVELSPELAAVARRAVPEAEIVVADFEEWEPLEARFDAVTAFTTFHWLAPEIRCTKPAQLLRPGGALAVVAAPHVLPPDADPFWVDVQEDYAAVVPHPDNRPPPAPEEIEGRHEELRASGLFETVEERRHLEAIVYTADEHIAHLGTFSPNIALPAEQREELFRRIHRRIEAAGGVVTAHRLVTVTVAQRPR
jgi:SAM-dependent methyltransferase